MVDVIGFVICLLFVTTIEKCSVAKFHFTSIVSHTVFHSIFECFDSFGWPFRILLIHHFQVFCSLRLIHSSAISVCGKQNVTKSTATQLIQHFSVKNEWQKTISHNRIIRSNYICSVNIGDQYHTLNMYLLWGQRLTGRHFDAKYGTRLTQRSYNTNQRIDRTNEIVHICVCMQYGI